MPSIQSMAVRMAIALVAASVLAKLLEPWIGQILFLVPGMVWERLAVWQFLTFVFLEGSPLGIIFGAMIVGSMGGALESLWGSRRLLFFSVGVTVLAGVLTTLLALVFPALKFLPIAGGMVLTSSLWVAFGLAPGPQRQTYFWGMAVRGDVLAAIGVGFVLLSGLFGSWLQVVPELIGIGLTYSYLRWGSPSSWLLRLQGWRLQKQLRGRSKHLRVISKDRNTSSDSDRFLH